MHRGESGEKRHVGKFARVIWAWRGTLTIIFISALLYLLFSSTKASIMWITQDQLPYYIFGAALLALAIHTTYIEIEYANFFYILGDEELIVRHGVFSTERVLIPYAKIQNVNVSRNVLNRILGTATLKIETAGGNPGEAEATIPSVPNFEKVVDEISERMENAKERLGRKQF